MRVTENQSTLQIISVFEQSKELVESIVDNLGFMLLVIDKEGSIYRVNQEMANLFNCSIENVAGQNIAQFFNKEQAQLICWNANKIANNLMSKIQMECPYVETGSSRVLLLELKKLISNSRTSLFTLSGSDITEFQMAQKKKVQLELELESEKKNSLRLSVLASYNEILVEDGFNKAFENVIGKCLKTLSFTTALFYEFNSTLGTLKQSAIIEIQNGNTKLVSDALLAQEEILLERADQRLASVIKKSASDWQLFPNGLPEFGDFKTSVLLYLRFENISYGIIELRSKQIIKPEEFTMDLFIEISEKLSAFIYQVKLKSQINEKNILIETASKMIALGEIAGGIAHEINNPLTIVYGKLSLILKLIKSENFDKGKFETNIEQVLNTLDRIATIIKGLRIFSRDGLSNRFSNVKLEKSINNALAICQERIAKSGLNIRLSIDGAALVRGNESQIEHVLIHIINNACDAVENLSEKWLEIKVIKNTGFNEVCLTDSGKGLPRELASKIFQPFFTTKDPGKGTGLGLSISFGIVKAHGGQLYLNPNHPHTQFILSLPEYIQKGE
jgi:PAS domain S-box-containing protein